MVFPLYDAAVIENDPPPPLEHETDRNQDTLRARKDNILFPKKKSKNRKKRVLGHTVAAGRKKMRVPLTLLHILRDQPEEEWHYVSGIRLALFGAPPRGQKVKSWKRKDGPCKQRCGIEIKAEILAETAQLCCCLCASPFFLFRCHKEEPVRLWSLSYFFTRSTSSQETKKKGVFVYFCTSSIHSRNKVLRVFKGQKLAQCSCVTRQNALSTPGARFLIVRRRSSISSRDSKDDARDFSQRWPHSCQLNGKWEGNVSWNQLSTA